MKKISKSTKKIVDPRKVRLGGVAPSFDTKKVRLGGVAPSF
jgi:hypothetical protein